MAFPHAVTASELPALEGDLTACPSADVYTLLSTLGLSGRLQFVRALDSQQEERVELRVRQGRLIGAETSGARTYLGELLVKQFGVSIEAVIEGLKRQSLAKRSGRVPQRLGQLLLETRQVSADVLRRALEESIARLAVPVLAWEQGRFSFWSEGSGLSELMAEPAELVRPDVRLEELMGRAAGPGPTPIL
ncbi:MAG TPA: DUF4388 domain-containing protein [Candidatus Eisenbacteria bacterium]|nr:DUF4388 domain-containing protein [Candidatus Eisenbacteria bacterium]